MLQAHRAVSARVPQWQTDRFIIIVVIIITIVITVVKVERDALLDRGLAEHRRGGGGHQSVRGPQNAGPSRRRRRRSTGHQDLIGFRPSTVVATSPFHSASTQLHHQRNRQYYYYYYYYMVDINLFAFDQIAPAVVFEWFSFAILFCTIDKK